MSVTFIRLLVSICNEKYPLDGIVMHLLTNYLPN